MTTFRPRGRTGMRAACLAVCAVAVWAFAAPSARGQDSDAPPGAGPSWIPNDEWVVEHWLPYRDSDLFRELRTTPADLSNWLSDKRTLGDLARRRGLQPPAVVARLVAPWRGRVARRHLAELQRRAMKTFTQGHLMLHMLYHPFHDAAVDGALPRILGVGHYSDILKARSRGLSYLEIGREHGKSGGSVKRGILGIVKRSMGEAVRRKWTPREHARAWLAFIRTQIDGYLAYHDATAPGM